MKYGFRVYQMEVDDHAFWVAESAVLKGCVGQGESADEAIQELAENEVEWLTTAKEFGIPIPQTSVQKELSFSGKFSLRISPFVHEEAHCNAKELGISLNQYFNDAIVDYNAMYRNRRYRPSTNLVEYSDSSVISLEERRNRNSVSIKLDMEEM